MKVSENFDIREFVPRATWQKWGINSRWFVSEWMVTFCQWLRGFLYSYYKAKHPDLKYVMIKVNDWSYGGSKQYSGYRPPSCGVGADESDHRRSDAVDTEVILVFNDGSRKEADYAEIHELVRTHEEEFMAQGLTCIESLKDAPGWMHWSKRWTNLKNILVVRYKK